MRKQLRRRPRTRSPLTPRVYHCRHCGQYPLRASSRQWVLSYCDRTDRRVHLMRVNSSVALADLGGQFPMGLPPRRRRSVVES